MTNQVVLITGALAGIGRATALAFAREGASVVIRGPDHAHFSDTGVSRQCCLEGVPMGTTLSH